MNASRSTTSPAPRCGVPITPLRAWGASLLATELLLAALFAVCTTWLAISSPTDGPMITDANRAHFWWVGLGYSARVFLGYTLIGLALGTVSWLLAMSWASLRGRTLTRRFIRIVAATVFGALLGYQFVALSVLNPQVLSNTLTPPWGATLIGSVGDVVPRWAVVALRWSLLGTAAVLLFGGCVHLMGRAHSPRRALALVVSVLLVVTVAGLGLGLALEPEPAKPRLDGRPNILILASDGLQTGHLGLYGYKRPTTPNLDRLGADAVRFTNCYVPTARTLVSWTSMLTGTWPHTHGLRHSWPAEPHIKMKLPTLCRELAKAGYRSCVFSDWAGSDFGKVDYGFDEKRVAPEAWSVNIWIAQATCRAHPLLVALGDNLLGRTLLPELRGMPVNPDPQSVTHDAVGELAQLAKTGQPFFMIVFYSETHLPYATRYPYYRRFADPNYEGPHKVTVYMPDPRVAASGEFDPETGFDRDQLRALYDGAVLSFDDQLGQVVRKLHELNLWDDTLVAVTSDHGEDLLEVPLQYGHGHGFVGDDYDNRIPLVISDPALRGGGERVIGEPASSIDLMPTLLERVGLSVPSTCEGQSLLDLIRGERPERDRAIFAEAGVLLDGGRTLPNRKGLLLYPPLMDMFRVTDLASGQVGLGKEYEELLIRARHRMVRTRDWKLVYMPTEDGGARYALYDLVHDPACSTDVSAKHPAEFAKLRKQLWHWMEADPLRRRQGEQLVPIAQTPAP